MDTNITEIGKKHGHRFLSGYQILVRIKSVFKSYKPKHYKHYKHKQTL